jgi:serine O-acetyltransferase
MCDQHGIMSAEMRPFPLSADATGYDELAPAVPKAPFSFTILLRLLYSDYRRYRAVGARNLFSVIVLTQGFWASSTFRLSHWVHLRLRVPGLRVVVKAGCVLLQKLIEVLSGISIPAACDIGAGLYVGHFGGIFIDSQCRLGRNCNISQGVTIGEGGRGELRGVPVLGDRVHVGANAVLLGKITIGDDAVIGPGAVVMSSVPPCGVAVGNPARVVGSAGSFEFVTYDEMENDPARKLALQRRDLAGSSTERGGRALERVIQLITQIGGIGPVAPDAGIYEAGFSSVRTLELLLALEEEYRVIIPDKDFVAARTPRDIAGLLDRLQQTQAA